MSPWLLQRAWEEAHREETERKKREEREGRVDTIAPYLPLLQVSGTTSIWLMVGEALICNLNSFCLSNISLKTVKHVMLRKWERINLN